MLWLKNIIETAFGMGMFVNAIMFVPQFIKLWRTKSAASISLITFIGFNIIQILMMAHAYFHDDYILLLGAGLSLLTCGSITVLASWYRHKILR